MTDERGYEQHESTTSNLSEQSKQLPLSLSSPESLALIFLFKISPLVTPCQFFDAEVKNGHCFFL